VAALAYDWNLAREHVARRDRALANVIRALPRARLAPRRARTPFEDLARAIVFQQLSGKAAATIHGRLRELFPARRPTPAILMALPDDALRGAGISRAKLAALRDLAAHSAAGRVPGWASLERMSDEQIARRLTAVRGIGRWTVEMLLLFSLGRPDVLPVQDLGVRKGLARAHGLAAPPDTLELERAAERWRPFRSVGSWYCWRALELA
jgi:3-methyladenine DNA glycosylase/8-oxoguanine DNA glycosylase